jgi:DNA-binding SARP family transcriptional activator
VSATIRLLGDFRIEIDGRQIPAAAWPRRHAAALVKLLALRPGHQLHRDRVIDSLWPDLSVEEAAPRLYKAAHYARRVLGRDDAIVLRALEHPHLDPVGSWGHPHLVVEADAGIFAVDNKWASVKELHWTIEQSFCAH